MDNIKNIILDIGYVLAKPVNNNWFITRHFFEILNKKYVALDELNECFKRNLHFQTQDPKNEDEEFKMFSKYYYNVLKDIKYPNYSIKLAEKLAYDLVYDDEKYIFYDDVKKYLEENYKKYDLYIISDAWPSTYRIVKKYGLENYFKGIVISSLYGTVKKEKLFELFLEEYKVNPEESIFVDDREKNLRRAKDYNLNLKLLDRRNIIKGSEFEIIYELNQIL